ncbi:MAG: ribosomal-processing cysteine protease Prp [Phascolarctobacterium sp.]|nr:ribosomal-processing cysteine protease Prp [Phascolarctobacterium sp.]
MIKIDVTLDKNGMITGYKVGGHAGSVKAGEYDLICNSVSVLTQAPIIGLERHLKRKPFYRVDEVDGILEVALNSAPDELSQALLMTMYYGVEELAQEFPQYVRIKEHRR